MPNFAKAMMTVMFFRRKTKKIDATYIRYSGENLSRRP